MTTLTCANCGSSVPAESRFCARCGSAERGPSVAGGIPGTPPAVGMPMASSTPMGFPSAAVLEPMPMGSPMVAGAPPAMSSLVTRLGPGETPRFSIVLHHGEVLVSNSRVLMVSYPRIFFELIKVGRHDNAQRLSAVTHVAYGRDNNVVGIALGVTLIIVGIPALVAFGAGLLLILLGVAVIWEAIRTTFVVSDQSGNHLGIKVRVSERDRVMSFMSGVEHVLNDRT